MSRELSQLKRRVEAAREDVRAARSSYVLAARGCLIADLLALLAATPRAAALALSADYEYDDEGGYYLCVTGALALSDDASADCAEYDYWTEAVDFDREVLLELFGIDGAGEGVLTRPDLELLAREEGISPPSGEDSSPAGADRAGGR